MSAEKTLQDKEELKDNLSSSEDQEQVQETEDQNVETQNEAESEEQEQGPEAEIERLKAALEAEKDQKLRLYADFENHRKRTAKERIELFGSANQELMSALLPVVDDFKRALSNIEDEKVAEGIQLVFNKFENTLKQKGLKPMEDTRGKDFDVDTMEAITRIPAPSEDLKGKVVDEIEQGFYLGNKIIRYARVVVGE